MRNSNRKDKTNIIIYILSILLSAIVFYITIRTTIAAQALLPQNSIQVSSLTGKRMMPTFMSSSPVEVTYTTLENTVSLDGLSEAEIIFEYTGVDGRPYYKGLFDKAPSKRTNPIVSIDKVSSKLLPKLSFIDSIDMPSDFTKSAKSIFITFSYNIFSNFIYEDSLYHHYRDTYKDIDKSSSKPITVSNVIVQFVNSKTEINSPHIDGRGKGLLFCGGKVIDIKWDKDKDKPIKVVDEDGKPVSLIRGKTWWVVLHENSSVAYN